MKSGSFNMKSDARGASASGAARSCSVECLGRSVTLSEGGSMATTTADVDHDWIAAEEAEGKGANVNSVHSVLSSQCHQAIIANPCLW